MCFLVVFVACVMLVMAQVPLTVAVRPDGTEPAHDLPNRGGEGRQLTAAVEKLPVDSIERFLAEKASSLGHAGVCLMWGPMPQARVAAALDGAGVCAQTLLVIEAWELDTRCAGAQGVRVPAGQSRSAESGYESVADAGEGWTVGVVCGEGEVLREHLSLHSSGFVDVIVHTAAFAHMLEPLDYKQVALLEQLMAPSGRLVLASPSYLVSVVHDAQRGSGGGGADRYPHRVARVVADGHGRSRNGRYDCGRHAGGWAGFAVDDWDADGSRLYGHGFRYAVCFRRRWVSPPALSPVAVAKSEWASRVAKGWGRCGEGCHPRCGVDTGDAFLLFVRQGPRCLSR